MAQQILNPCTEPVEVTARPALSQALSAAEGEANASSVTSRLGLSGANVARVANVWRRACGVRDCSTPASLAVSEANLFMQSSKTWRTVLVEADFAALRRNRRQPWTERSERHPVAGRPVGQRAKTETVNLGLSGALD